MEINVFNSLLLKTAFSCMACDGDIDDREIELIKSLANDKKIFGDIVIQDELDRLIQKINEDGHQFLKNYLTEISKTSFEEKEELKIIEIAVKTINADDVIEYSEIKFFKIIRSKLKIKNDKILEYLPNIQEEYLEHDIISPTYLFKLQNDFFNNYSLPQFSPIKNIDDDIITSFKK